MYYFFLNKSTTLTNMWKTTCDHGFASWERACIHTNVSRVVLPPTTSPMAMSSIVDARKLVAPTKQNP